jgi:hypothetical protein
MNWKGCGSGRGQFMHPYLCKPSTCVDLLYLIVVTDGTIPASGGTEKSHEETQLTTAGLLAEV